ncbi:AzlD domain-containing protein [Streptomyces sp. NPDC050732]|uniref:AzlD domain-containing protein n=1 Tax=Streptomyces sp. NPDC050732 TaxID=3154632 RepID=UPI0034380E79
MNATLACVLALAAGTYVFRLAGPVLHGRVELPARAQELLAVAATVLLVALLATGALTEGHDFAGWARPAGVLLGGVLAWRRAPFAVVVVAAAATTALLRLAGVQ